MFTWHHQGGVSSEHTDLGRKREPIHVPSRTATTCRFDAFAERHARQGASPLYPGAHNFQDKGGVGAHGLKVVLGALKNPKSDLKNGLKW